MSKICFYHNPCPDGITALWCVNKAIPNIYCRGISPQDDRIIEKYYKNKELIFVDVIPSEQKLIHMLEIAKKITIIDHHISNEKIIEKYIEHPKMTAIFDMELSGCQLTWDYFHKSPRPWFVDYVGDRDLWKFELPNSKLINIALIELDYLKLEELNSLYDMTKDEENKKKLIERHMIPAAKILDRKNEKMLNAAMGSSLQKVIKINDLKYDVWVVSGGILTSELGNRLMQKKFNNNQLPDFVFLFDYRFKDDLWKVSLRSEIVDVSVIATSFGGGGHPKAAGFEYKGNIQQLFE